MQRTVKCKLGVNIWKRKSRGGWNLLQNILSQDIYLIARFAWGGGFFHQNRTWMCLPDLENLYTNFLPNFPPISIPFSKEKHPIWIKLGAFYNNLPEIHPIYAIWAPSSLMKTPRSLYQISRKSAPKGRHIYVYHVNVRTPPGRFAGDIHAMHGSKMTQISFLTVLIPWMQKQFSGANHVRNG